MLERLDSAFVELCADYVLEQHARQAADDAAS
jgi:hypothetical protein